MDARRKPARAGNTRTQRGVVEPRVLVKTDSWCLLRSAGFISRFMQAEPLKDEPT